METENIESIGSKLREARERKGLSAETVSRETMLTLRYVQALETDDYAALPGTAFVRGYVRRYAELVGLNADELIATFDESLPSSKRLVSVRPILTPDESTAVSSSTAGMIANKIPLSRLLVIVAVIAFVLYVLAGLFWQSNPIETQAEIAVPMDIDEEMTADVVATEVEPVQVTPTTEPDMVTPESDETVVTTDPTAAPVISQTAPPTIETLSFSFTGASWISVRDGTGQELVYGQKNAGQSVTVSGQPPFAINIGAVNFTSLIYNGSAVDLQPFARGNIASFRLGRQD
ncbi:MAG: DUF4115 domain-containing protein [Moraxellaceae bacterium]|nr:DUF4115 domain-containing protein [Moraxellaceae bacterium]MDZ4386054.1 DUF4115 domain-containing protein [Moraxellaceae bacterium]